MPLLSRLALPLVAVSLLAAPAARAAAPWVIDGVRLHRDDGKGAPGPVVGHFFPEDHAHHVVVHFKSLKLGVFSAHIVFTAVDTEAGENIKIAETDTPKTMAVNEIAGHVTLPRDFPIGLYRCDVSVNGQAMARVDYTVLARPEKWKILGHTFHVGDGKGGLGAPVERVPAGATLVVVKARSNGLVPGTRTTWVWTAVKQGKNQSYEISRATVAVAAQGAFTLNTNLDVPKGLPAGEYRVDLLVQDKPMASFPFTVAPR